jgi:diguanylate cyclase (GGDEF)-like protein
MATASNTFVTPIFQIPRTSLARRRGAVALASLALLLMLATLGVTIAGAQHSSRAHIQSTFHLRGTSAAEFVSNFVSQQASRERSTAQRYLAGTHPSQHSFAVLADTFGSRAAVLLDSRGRVLDVTPSDPRLEGSQLAARYAHLSSAERGRTAVSGVVPSAVRSEPVVAIAVPFQTPAGRRVFSVAYGLSQSTLAAFLDQTIAYRQHDVFLIDGAGRLVASSPATGAPTLADADAGLASAFRHATHGAVSGAHPQSTFTSAVVPGTPWHLLIAVPDTRLYASISGPTHLLPWIVLVLVSAIGALLVALFARTLHDRARLARLSEQLDRTARTDSLTDLYNRRALAEHLVRASAHARRSGRPLSALMIDLDRFKQTNDRFGHEAGDQVLCALADCMRDVLRTDDVYGRWGGDEFLIVLPDTDERQAQPVVARLLQAAREVDLRDVGLEHGIEMSIGCACATITSPEEIVRQADVALLATKARRRSRRLASV